MHEALNGHYLFRLIYLCLQDIEYADGRRPSKIKFSSPEDDAKRRDFTINGMFYNPISKEILDYVDGKKDLEKKTIKAIGNPHSRFKEDRLRMIRAIRLSARFDFLIEEETKKAIISHAEELFPSVAIERIWQEFTKMSLYRGFKKSLISLFEFNLLQTIFPNLKKITLDEVIDRLDIIDDFPHQTPVIISILELFPTYNLEKKIELCKYLKLSNREIDFVTFLHHSKKLIEDHHKIDDHTWVKFFSSPNSELAIDIIAIHISKDNRASFLEFLNSKQIALKKFILRVKNKDPVLKSDHLKLSSIKPGMLMGTLLKEGEKISINKKIFDPHKVIELLKKTKFWPKDH